MEPELIDRFATHGWVVVPDVLDAANIDAANKSLGRIYPSAAELRAAPESYDWIRDGQFGGVRLWPVDDVLLDLLPLDARIVAIAESLMGTTDIRLLRAGYQAKYAGAADYAQVLHYDYPNHSLVVPGDDDIVGFFVYLSDVTEDLGPTMLLSDQVRGAVTPDRTHPDPTTWPELYAAERPAVGPAGSVLAYRSTTYHRGSAFTAEEGRRLTLGFTYAKPAPWTGYTSFPRLGEERGLINAIVAASPRQRELFGFPAVGDPYWTPLTVAAVARRFLGMDTSAYA